MSPYLPTNHPLLRSVMTLVEEDLVPSAEIQEAIDRLISIADEERAPSKRGALGLAAPQIGIDQRIIVVDLEFTDDTLQEGPFIAFINPEITWTSEELLKRREGCLSVDPRIQGVVTRPASVAVRALDRNGQTIETTYHGLTARILQHEIDHLNGILFPDRIGKEGTLHWVEPHEINYYRKNWKKWNKCCSWETWLALKQGQPINTLKQGKNERDPAKFTKPLTT